MKFNYKLRRLCGAYYGHPVTTAGSNVEWSGSNVIYDSTGNLLISSVSNRIQVLDLRSHTVRTLPVEARSNIRCLALSPFDDTLLIAVDVQNYALLINFHRGIVLHRFRFKRKVRQVLFSPNGSHLAVTHGKHVQVWCTPSARRKEFAPLIQHRIYTGQAEDVTCMSWSSDSSVVAAGSRDCSIRIWTLQTVRDYEPVTLSGHKRPVVGVFLISNKNRIESCYSVSEDGALVTWECEYKEEETIQVQDDQDSMGEEAVTFFTGGTVPTSSSLVEHTTSEAHQLVQGTWKVKARHYFKQDECSVTSVSYEGSLLAVGFSSGLFGVYEMPSVANIHTLSVGTNLSVKACTLNPSGDWLALGCPTSQQLLVWEWRSETYVLKQRGHAFGMRCMAYSQDGVIVCTGGEDGKIKLWNATSGFCYVTLEKTHTAPVTAVCFANSSVVLSSSLDGTVRAHDLHRYRTFKTLTTPKPVQFLSLAVDPAGEIVTAGSTDPFHIYAWNLQTGKLLDIFTGHLGPVCSLAFANTGGTLASASWDGTVKLWDLYKGNVPTESLQHSSDVVCVSFRPDGKEVCTGTIGGLLSFWDVEHARLKCEIDGRRDIAGGRKMNDRMTADNNAAGRYFTSVCYSADGSCVLAGGNSKYVCIYEISQQMLLKKFQVTFNRSLDGVLDELNSKNLGEAGPIDDHADAEVDESTFNAMHLPGARRNDDGSRRSKVEVLTMAVSFSSTGREWAAVSGEGLHVYSLDEDMIFDPISLTEAITPAAVHSKLGLGDHGLALRMALHLNEASLVQEVMEHTPFSAIPLIVRSFERAEPTSLERLLQSLSEVMANSPHVEFYLQWCLELLQTQGLYMEQNRGSYMRAFRALHKVVQTRQDDLRRIADENKYLLDFVHDHSQLPVEKLADVQ